MLPVQTVQSENHKYHRNSLSGSTNPNKPKITTLHYPSSLVQMYPVRNIKSMKLKDIQKFTASNTLTAPQIKAALHKLSNALITFNFSLAEKD